MQLLDYLIQNFNWPTFLLALGVFALINSLYNLVMSYILKARAEKRVKLADKKFFELKEQLRTKQVELDKLLGKKESK